MKKFILRKLYDIRPLREDGEIDYEWIKYGKSKTTNPSFYQYEKKESAVDLQAIKPQWEKERDGVKLEGPSERKLARVQWYKSLSKSITSYKPPIPRFPVAQFIPAEIPRSFVSFLLILILIGMLIPGFSLVSGTFNLKGDIMASGFNAYENILKAQQNLLQFNAPQAQINFQDAYKNFSEASDKIGILGRLVLNVADKIPGSNLLSSGSNLLQAGKHLSKAGSFLAKSLSIIQHIDLNNVFAFDKQKQSNQPSPSTILKSAAANLEQARMEAQIALQYTQGIDASHFPSPYQDKIQALQKLLPQFNNILAHQKDYFTLAQRLLGARSYKKYLVIFQNNSEIRPTGGFIGSYAQITLNQGRVTDLKVDDIYNIDGQLLEKVIPPKPIQKISTAWSTHDANWFFDFPTSAQKIMWFYEKTGRPTVDGVIAITPQVVKKILARIGPVHLPSYQVTIDKNNFLEVLQTVEQDYKNMGQPKRILADITPRILSKLGSMNLAEMQLLLQDLQASLAHKEILLYSQDSKLQEFIESHGWGGNVLSGTNDYLAVVNANINGYKTDRYIHQKIDLEIKLNSSGKITHNLSIKRVHKGGDIAGQPWYNKVNADYMRIFIPQGAKIISASGFTKEQVADPIDYQKHGFEPDPLVQKTEQKKTYDQKTGIYLGSEHSKKVIGGWVYTSPGETTTIKLQYNTNFSDFEKGFSFLAQKQPGQINNLFNLTLTYPKSKSISWYHPQNLNINGNKITFASNLKQDFVMGVEFK